MDICVGFKALKAGPHLKDASKREVISPENVNRTIIAIASTIKSLVPEYY